MPPSIVGAKQSPAGGKPSPTGLVPGGSPAPLLAKRLVKNFSHSLDGAPAILPVSEMALRRQLEHWFDSHRVRPRVVAEVEDTALLTDLGAQGLGFVPVYSAVLDEVARSSRFQTIGIAKGLRMEIFAINRPASPLTSRRSSDDGRVTISLGRPR
jgi:hypothetical protein